MQESETMNIPLKSTISEIGQRLVLVILPRPSIHPATSQTIKLTKIFSYGSSQLSTKLNHPLAALGG